MRSYSGCPERKSGFHPGSSPEIRQPHPISPESAIPDVSEYPLPGLPCNGNAGSKIIIETTDQRDLPVQKTMSVNAGKLRLSLMFLDSIMIIESRLHPQQI